MDFKAGDLIRFGRINGHCPSLNNKVGLYLGEAFIHRENGKVIQNHKVLMVGLAAPTIIDNGLLRWMHLYNPNEEK